jgi:uncharacterized phiE125 gp8 family phage protein
VDTTADNALITALIVAAREEVERRTWRALMTQTLELVIDEWPSGGVIELPRPPLQSVSSITYRTSDGETLTLAATDYVVAADGTPGRVVLADGVGWPNDELWPAEAIRVRYVAGHGAAASVPQSLRQAMLLVIGHWYEHREAVSDGAALHDVPMAVDVLCQSYRYEVRR